MRIEYDRNRSLNFKHFWLRLRLAHFAPFYLVLVAVTVAALIYAPAGSMSIAALGAQALHFTNYWIIYHGETGLPPNGGTGVYWSLAVEEHFYLLFPWVYVLMRKGNVRGRHQALILGHLRNCSGMALRSCHLVPCIDGPNLHGQRHANRLDSVRLRPGGLA